MIHLQPDTAALLRTLGAGSISRGVMRLVDKHAGKLIATPAPARRTVQQVRATERARRRAQEALEVVNRILNEKLDASVS